MSRALPRRTPLAAGWSRRNGVARALAFIVAVLVLCASLSAEAKKKKKGGKKHKTPATKSTGKSLPPSDMSSGADDDDDDEKPSSSAKTAPDEEEDKPKATPPPEPVGDEDAAAKKPAKTKPAPEKAEAEGAGGPIALKIGVGGRALFRQLRWTDDMGALAPYTLSPGPEASVWLEAYPAAFVTDGFAANIGIFGRFDYGFGASSKTPPPQNQTLTTKYQDFLAGLKVRIPLGMVLPYGAAAYGMQKFALTPLDPTRPNFNYSFAHLGAGALFQVTPEFDIDVAAGFLYVMNPGSAAGEVKAPALYPRAAANGIDVSLSLGYRVISMIGVRLGVDFRQFGIATGWRTGDAATRAGGAVDRNISVWGGVEVVFDGMGGGGGEEAPPPKKAPKAKKPVEEGGEPEEGKPEVDSEQ